MSFLTFDNVALTYEGSDRTVLALDADLLLMDEPLSALDALRREDLQDVLLELWHRRSHAQVLVTHSIEEAVFLGRRIVVMSPRPGRVGSVVENPEMGEADYRESPSFYERCAAVRAILAAEGALHAEAAEVGA
jgi:NitT/TauT family transport system ATP-binding protein